jgi:hypothetical protein
LRESGIRNPESGINPDSQVKPDYLLSTGYGILASLWLAAVQISFRRNKTLEVYRK